MNHVSCLVQELPDGKWFCRSECRNIHSALQNLVADGERRIPDLVLDLIRKKHEETGSQDDFDSNITWRLLHGQTASEQDRKWLSDAVSVFHVSIWLTFIIIYCMPYVVLNFLFLS